MSVDKKATGAWEAPTGLERASGSAPSRSRWSRLLCISLAACIIGTVYYAWAGSPISCNGGSTRLSVPIKATEALCPQTELLSPQLHKEYADSLDTSLKDSETKSWVLENLVGAVRVP